jgi:hypothetical protein
MFTTVTSKPVNAHSVEVVAESIPPETPITKPLTPAFFGVGF